MKSSYIFKHIAGTLIFFLILFISAGTLDYWQGLVFVIIGIIMFILSYTVLKPDKELLNERAKPGEGTKDWDKKLLGLSFLATLGMYITAGLDSGRYQWSPVIPLELYIAGILLTVSGQLLFLYAQKQNKFFSSTVRIQSDREHAVCETGPYKIVRHPAYLGLTLQSIGFPLLLGSLWSFIPVGLLTVIHLARTILEDRTLMKELKGYAEYSRKTRYRLVPFIW